MSTESKRDFIINITYLAIVFVIAFFSFKYFFGVLFPFVLGFIIAFSLRPLIKWINSQVEINNAVVSILVLLLFYSIIGTGAIFVIIKVITMLKDLFEDIPQMFASDIQPLINQFTVWANDLFYKINPEIIGFIQQFDQNILEQLGSIVRNFSSGAINFLTSMLTKLPNFLIGFLLTIISSFFITIDYTEITRFLTYQFNEKNREVFTAVKRNGIDVVVNFFKAYGILLTVTFIESAIGLSILRIDNAIGISIIVALVDIVPILGTGTILVPWSIVEFFNGNLQTAIGLAVVYAIITIIRQVLEPRVVGESIGLYPLVTLIAMFLGVKMFGGFGLLALPIALTIFVKLHEEGILEIYKTPSKSKKIERGKNV